MSLLSSLAADLPKCAAKCLVDAVLNSTCELTDPNLPRCVCSNEAINAQANVCVLGSCTIREGLFTKNLTATSCGIAPREDHTTIPVLSAFLALSAVAVLLRIVARLKARVPMWWDDFIISLSCLGCLAFTIIGLILTYRGLGTDLWGVRPDDITFIFKGLYVLFILYITSRDLVRLSILLFYHRIFGQIPVVRRLIQFTFVLIIACSIAFDLAIIFGCTPIDHFWNKWDGEHEGHCISTHGIFWAGAVIVTLIDIWVMIIPLPFIARLNFSLRKKILSGIMFTFGIFVVIVSLYRFNTITRFTKSLNPTYDFVDVGIWSGLELYVGIICACLPHLHVLLKPMYGWIGLASGSTNKSGSGSGSEKRSGSGSGSGKHRRLHDLGPMADSRIHAATTVDVEQHRSESQVHLGDGTAMGVEVEEIELSHRTRGETRSAAWS